MRILMVAPHPFFQERGTPLAEREILRALADGGHELHVLTYHEGDSVSIPNCTIHRIRSVPFVRGIRPGLSWKKLVCDALLTVDCLRLVREIRFDVIHAVEEAAFIGLVVERLYGVPYVYDMDSALAVQAESRWRLLRPLRPLLQRLEKLAVRESLSVLAVCRLLEERARAFAPDRPVTRLEDVSLLGEAKILAERIADRLDPPGPVIMYVGNLEPYQGIDLLIDGFAKLRRRWPDAHLVLIGGRRADVERYRRIIARRALDDRVHLLGPRPHASLEGYLRQADILVSPRTNGVNTPMKVYSYMDSGRPLAATRLPTHTQVLTDEMACLFDPDPQALAEGLDALLGDPERAAALAARAKREARVEYSREAFRRKLLRFYAAVEETLDIPVATDPDVEPADVGLPFPRRALRPRRPPEP